jgi:hypothetical protein
MSGVSQQYSEPHPKWKALVVVAVALVIAAMTPVIQARLPDYARPWNMSVIGAIGIFAASRLGFLWAVGFTALAIGLKDQGYYYTRGWHADPLSLPCFIVYAATGWALLRRNQSPSRIAAGAISGSLLFFFVSNFTCWLDPNMRYEQSLPGLGMCFINAIPFFRGTLLGDLVFTGVLFGAYALMTRASFPVRQPVGIEMDQKG